MQVAMARDTGLRTSPASLSRVIMDTPAYARTSADHRRGHQHYPELEDKIHIVQNAIDLALALGIREPKVALLSRSKTVEPQDQVPRLDAAALCKMAESRPDHRRHPRAGRWPSITGRSA